jgi:hypothetical protein
MPTLTNAYLISQLLALAGTIIVAIGMQQKKYDHIVLSKITNEFLGAVHYILLGGYTGMAMNFASCMTNGVYWYRIKKGKSTLPFQIIFGIMFVAIGAMSWQGPISIFVVLAKLISSVSLGIKHPRIIRILNLISNPCWLIYNAYFGSIAGMMTDSVITISTLIAFIRLDVLKRDEEKKATGNREEVAVVAVGESEEVK